MIKWAPLVFVRFTFFLICGILVHIYSGFDFSRATYFFGGAAFLYVLLLAIGGRKSSAAWKSFLGITATLCTFLFGVALTQVRTEKFDQNHLLHFQNEVTYYKGNISSYVTQKPKTFKAEITISHVRSGGKWQPVKGNIQASIEKNDVSGKLRYGDEIVVKGNPLEVKPPSNPMEFNYKEFLAFKNIYHQHFIRSGTFSVISHGHGNAIVSLAFHIRKHLDDMLRRNIPGQQEYGLAKALVLGITDELDNAIMRAYSGAGVMHVLAVSGLHVGIIYAVLEILLRRVGKGKKRTFFSSVFSLLFIWLYAFVTGFSASVLRAVVMFSFFSIGKLLLRQNASYNVLALSAFCLLCFDPYLIMQVGFQLSYLAVFGIIYLHPRIHRLLEFESQIVNWIWTITSISIAAQIATSPLAIYYFHQFPVYFIFTNLLIIPVSTIILNGGLSVLFLGLLPGIGDYAAHWLGIILNWGIWFMNKIIFFFEALPFSILNGIVISRSEAILIYAVIALLLVFVEVRKLKYFVAATALVLVFTVFQLQETQAQKTNARFAVYNMRKQSAIDFLEQGSGVFVADTSLLNNPPSLEFFIRKNWWSRDVKEPMLQASNLPLSEQKTIADLPDGNKLIVQYGKSVLLISQPLKVKFPESRLIDYVVIQHNAKVDIGDLLAKVDFRKLIFDSSNSNYYLKKKKQEAENLKLEYYSVPDQGAYVEYFPLKE